MKIGEGKLSEPNDGYANIEILREILITNFSDPIVAIINSTYPDFIHHYQTNDYLKIRDILVSTLEVVDHINDQVLSLMSSLNSLALHLILFYVMFLLLR